MELRAARAWQVPPTRLRRDWTVEDRALAVALLMHEDSLGPCGFSHAVTLDPTNDGEGHYVIDDEAPVCPACAVLERWQETQTGGPGEPGRVLRLIDLREHPERDA